MFALTTLIIIPFVACDWNMAAPWGSLNVAKYETKADEQGRETMYIWGHPDETQAAYISGYLYLADIDKEIADNFCVKDRWHIWATVVRDTASLDQETQDNLLWLPTWCKAESTTPDSRTYADFVPGSLPDMPKVFVPDMTFDAYKKAQDDGQDVYVLFKSDTFNYENNTDLKPVCKPGHDFLGGVHVKREDPSLPYEKIEQMFENQFDPCLLIRHPCWCDRAPQEWNCEYCKLDDIFGRASLCYQAGSEAGKWCTAVTYQSFNYDKPNRPIDAEEYADLLEHRDEHEGEGIYWLDKAADALQH